jgi:DNA-binding GntR family transcriptional regulator
MPNWIQDELMPTLEIIEQIVLNRLIRLSLGFNRQITDSVGLTKLAEKCNITQTSLKKAIKSLENRGIIKVHRDLSGSSIGGNKYEMFFDYPVSKRPSLQKTL